MVRYKWKCNACERSNSEDALICEHFGCKVGASMEEVQRHNDPEAFNQKKVRATFEKEITKL